MLACQIDGIQIEETRSMNDQEKDTISVCICTYKRPEMLATTLKGILSQRPNPSYEIEIVIVDNDRMRSAENTVAKFAGSGFIKINYDCEPERSISLARNRTIRNANGNLIATIDDDEFPNSDWMSKMYQCLKASGADGVLGPVVPHFPSDAPKWLKKSGLCDRPRNTTGTPIVHGRTGNALFNRYVFEPNETWFDPRLGLIGGSDGMFLSKQVEKGRRFIWCDEAIVFEAVIEERWEEQFYFRRHFRIGALIGEVHRRDLRIWAIFKNVALLLVYGALFPLSMVSGKHVSVRILSKFFYNAGSLLSFFFLVRAKQKD